MYLILIWQHLSLATSLILDLANVSRREIETVYAHLKYDMYR